MREWLKGPLGDKVESCFKLIKMRDENLVDFDGWIALLNEHRKTGIDHAYPVWSLFNLALWYDRWIAE